MNVGPALSPDGRWMAFVSERSFVSMDLFVADAATGAIVARLTDTAGNPHYSNLQFIDSAGAWDRAGRRLAVGTMVSGRAAITVFGWPGGARELEVIIDDVDEIYSPTWSPDGRSIAFSAMVEGVTDLFVYDLDAKRLRRLTHDTFADMQAAWEPGGRRIAFVSDRFTSDPGALTFGDFRLAIIDVDSGIIEPVPAFTTGKHVSPQWSPDGRWLHFISDRDGTSDVYSIELETRRARPTHAGDDRRLRGDRIESGDQRRGRRGRSGVHGVSARPDRHPPRRRPVRRAGGHRGAAGAGAPAAHRRRAAGGAPLD